MSVTVAILISDTKCGIERNCFFIVLKAKVFGRKLDCISGLVGVHIDLQALALVLSADLTSIGIS